MKAPAPPPLDASAFLNAAGCTRQTGCACDFCDHSDTLDRLYDERLQRPDPATGFDLPATAPAPATPTRPQLSLF